MASGRGRRSEQRSGKPGCGTGKITGGRLATDQDGRLSHQPRRQAWRCMPGEAGREGRTGKDPHAAAAPHPTGPSSTATAGTAPPAAPGGASCVTSCDPEPFRAARPRVFPPWPPDPIPSSPVHSDWRTISSSRRPGTDQCRRCPASWRDRYDWEAVRTSCCRWRRSPARPAWRPRARRSSRPGSGRCRKRPLPGCRGRTRTPLERRSTRSPSDRTRNTSYSASGNCCRMAAPKAAALAVRCQTNRRVERVPAGESLPASGCSPENHSPGLGIWCVRRADRRPAGRGRCLSPDRGVRWRADCRSRRGKAAVSRPSGRGG